MTRIVEQRHPGEPERLKTQSVAMFTFSPHLAGLLSNPSE